MPSLFQRLKQGLAKTTKSFTHEFKRILSGSPKLDADTLEELEALMIQADLGNATTQEILRNIQKHYESQGKLGPDAFEVTRKYLVDILEKYDSNFPIQDDGLTIISLVGVNGTGKTTTAARLAHKFKSEGKKPFFAACDTFRAAAIDQLKEWSQRLDVPIVAGEYGADPAAVAHDAITSAKKQGADILLVDTAGRLHTKTNLMRELEKVYRVIDKQIPGAPHHSVLVLDATTGMNALVQAREFHKAVELNGLVITKLDGTSKGGMVVAIQKELGIPVKFIGVGEQPEDLQTFSSESFVEALFPEEAN